MFVAQLASAAVTAKVQSMRIGTTPRRVSAVSFVAQQALASTARGACKLRRLSRRADRRALRGSTRNGKRGADATQACSEPVIFCSGGFEDSPHVRVREAFGGEDDTRT